MPKAKQREKGMGSPHGNTHLSIAARAGRRQFMRAQQTEARAPRVEARVDMEDTVALHHHSVSICANVGFHPPMLQPSPALLSLPPLKSPTSQFTNSPDSNDPFCCQQQ